MDHFYTAVEERDKPEYKGKPVVVGADPKEGKGRGVVSTSNYEARRLGIKSGMPISQAWRLCPDAIYLPPNYQLYNEVSNQIMEILKRYADKFEQWGIDEAFLDVSSRVKDILEAKILAKQLKQTIFQEIGLTCSIGVGPNKLVAKIASDYQKPNGLTVVEINDAAAFLSPLSVRKLLWVGRKTEAKLRKMGIITIEDLTKCDPLFLVENFGVMGRQLHYNANGIDESEVEQRKEIRSISHETTFEEDTSTEEIILSTLAKIAEAVVQEVQNQRLFFKTVTVKLRYADFETHTRSRTLPFMTDRLKDLEKTAKDLLRVFLVSERNIRLIGVRVSNFVKVERQKTLI